MRWNFLGGLAAVLQLVALAADPAKAFSTDLHVALTREALLSGNRDGSYAFSDVAIQQIYTANEETDAILNHFSPELHVDSAAIAAATSRLLRLRQQVVRSLSQASPDGNAAREDLGSALHTLQDFYSHSNWVELGNHDICRELGRQTIGDPSPAEACRDDGASLVEGYREITSGKFIFGFCFVDAGICRHGVPICSSGLHKDDGSRPGHQEARRLALLATRDFVGQILTELPSPRARQALFGMLGPVGAVVDTTASMEAALDAGRIYLASAADGTSFLLSTFGDPAEIRVRLPKDFPGFAAGLAAIEPFGGGGTEEPILTALYRAAAEAEQGSTLFVVTDADAKDCKKAGAVADLLREKKIRLQGVPSLKAPSALCGGALTGSTPDEMRSEKSQPRVAGAPDEPRFVDFEFVELKGRPGHQGLFPLDAEPLAGSRPLGRARLEGVSAAVSFRLVSLQGEKLADLDLRPRPEGWPGEFAGPVALPGVPFRVAASGKDAAGRPFEIFYERVLQGRTVMVESLTPLPFAAPGSEAKLELAIRNAGPGAVFAIEAIGPRDHRAVASIPSVRLETGQSQRFSVKVAIPAKAAEGSIVPVLVQVDGGGPESVNTVSVDVLVTRNRPPQCPGGTPARLRIWPADGRWAAFELASATQARDPDGDPLEIFAKAVTQDEPVASASGMDDRRTSPDARGLGGSQVELRAERDPRGNGRVYRIAYEARDPGGFSCAGSFDIQVPATQGGTAIDNGQSFDSTAVSK